MWFNIIKNLKGKSKAKGSTLDASKIKINTDGECKEKLRKLIWFNTTEPAPNDVAQQVDTGKVGNALIDTKEFNKLPEEIACKILETIKSHAFLSENSHKSLKLAILTTPLEKNLGDNYRLLVGLDYRYVKADEDTIRYYILNGNEDVAWVMFPFSDLKKWKDAQ
tara:strand:+ start:840 stop:1334 length:495 start_codon:yes stop_codon:yes gene_type:complete